jgi:hypothetical protein
MKVTEGGGHQTQHNTHQSRGTLLPLPAAKQETSPLLSAILKGTMDDADLLIEFFNQNRNLPHIPNQPDSLIQHIQKGEGTAQQKLEVLHVMLGKNINITPKSYEAVFRSLFGRPFHQVMNQLAAAAPELFSADRLASSLSRPVQAEGDVSKQLQLDKQSLLHNIGRIQQSLERSSALPDAMRPQIQRLLPPAMELINRMINQPSSVLHALPQLEPELLQLHNQLGQVRGLLDSGNTQESIRQIQSIRTAIENLHVLSSEVISPSQDPLKPNQLTGRQILEWIRSIGLNYERGVAAFLGRELPQGNRETTPAAYSHNLKYILLKGMEGELSPQVRQLMEQALSHITGQQLLSKSEGNQSIQTMVVNLPIPWQDGTQPVRIQIKGKIKGKQMDVDNCHLFFFLDTPKFGETGISVQVIDRSVTIRIENHQEGIADAYVPYISDFKERLQQIGYHVQDVRFVQTKTQDNDNMTTLNKYKREYLSFFQRGVDLTI